MRKHNEGYVLPLVLVVMVILSLIAVGVMSVSLRNLQTQKADIERMKAQYAAQGEIEKTVAELETEIGKLIATAQGVDTAKAIVLSTVDNVVAVEQGESPKVTVGELTWSQNSNGLYTCKIPLNTTAEVGKVSIECIVVLNDVLKPSGEGQNVLFETPQVQYEAYEMVKLPESPETEVIG